ncbi:hypothetical protein [Fluviispira sanaruensis]|uniref:Phytanoyl-CoA dioxygenase n=1 Tax=Fluviispira sanaruensis TaxID=2493639 RepID=A0A4P2VQ51_FLUSA|nr:hypothetical protein [Fluviispira sanaruensis]BBH54079.1 hypothetical protein JCM31447_25360 [Fluviispira sanaruensis]
MNLNETLLRRYKEDGFVKIPNVFSKNEIDEIIKTLNTFQKMMPNCFLEEILTMWIQKKK